MTSSSFVCTSMIRKKRQSEHKFTIFWGQGPFALIGSHKLCASYTRNIHMLLAMYLWRWLWWKVAAAVLRTKIDWNNYNFHIKSFSWSCKTFNKLEFWNSYIWQILPVQLFFQVERQILVHHTVIFSYYQFWIKVWVNRPGKLELLYLFKIVHGISDKCPPICKLTLSLMFILISLASFKTIFTNMPQIFPGVN